MAGMGLQLMAGLKKDIGKWQFSQSGYVGFGVLFMCKRLFAHSVFCPWEYYKLWKVYNYGF